MTREKFKEYLAGLSDYELYLLAKKHIASQGGSVNPIDWQNEIIYSECRARHPDIYASAVDDANLILASRTESDGVFDVSDVLRPSLMSRAEFTNFIGNTKINDTNKFEIPLETVVREVLSGGDENYLFCKVSGDSMTNAAINDDDILLVDRNYDDIADKIVVASVNDILFVKRYKKYDGKQWLLSENEKYRPFEITPDIDFHIVGVVKMIMHNVG